MAEMLGFCLLFPVLAQKSRSTAIPMESTHWSAAREFDFRDEFAADSPLQRRVVRTMVTTVTWSRTSADPPDVLEQHSIGATAGLPDSIMITASMSGASQHFGAALIASFRVLTLRWCPSADRRVLLVGSQGRAGSWSDPRSSRGSRSRASRPGRGGIGPKSPGGLRHALVTDQN